MVESERAEGRQQVDEPKLRGIPPIRILGAGFHGQVQDALFEGRVVGDDRARIAELVLQEP